MASLSSNGIHTEFFSSQCPGASIYRLGAVRTVEMGRPDSQLCDKIFQKFRGEIFPV